MDCKRAASTAPSRLHTRIEEMAADYLSNVRRVQPNGPYHFAGFSFGGMVAFEMARQLQAQGERVALLLLIDIEAYAAHRTRSPANRLREPAGRQIRRIRLRGRNLLHLDFAGRLDYIRRRLHTLRRKLANRIWQMRYKTYEKLERPAPRSFQNVQQASYLALRQYVPGTYAGNAVLFRAERGWAISERDPALGWGQPGSGRSGSPHRSRRSQHDDGRRERRRAGGEAHRGPGQRCIRANRGGREFRRRGPVARGSFPSLARAGFRLLPPSSPFAAARRLLISFKLIGIPPQQENTWQSK